MTRRALQVLSILLVFAIAIATTWVLWPGGSAPEIEGAILPAPKKLPTVTLRDHHNKPISTADFNGRWHLVSYGFTYCPDICPTMLSALAKFQHLLEQQSRFNDLQIVFYTIDPQRDSSEQLAQYIGWFDQRFIGLRSDSPEQGERFEQSLGMRTIVNPSEDPAQYQVAHGFRLYLVDDHGQLRASLSPIRDRDGTQHFRPDTLLTDYLALRRWFASRG